MSDSSIVVSPQNIEKFKIDVITSAENFKMSFLSRFQGNLRYVYTKLGNIITK